MRVNWTLQTMATILLLFVSDSLGQESRLVETVDNAIDSTTPTSDSTPESGKKTSSSFMSRVNQGLKPILRALEGVDDFLRSTRGMDVFKCMERFACEMAAPLTRNQNDRPLGTLGDGALQQFGQFANAVQQNFVDYPTLLANQNLLQQTGNVLSQQPLLQQQLLQQQPLTIQEQLIAQQQQQLLQNPQLLRGQQQILVQPQQQILQPQQQLVQTQQLFQPQQQFLQPQQSVESDFIDPTSSQFHTPAIAQNQFLTQQLVRPQTQFIQQPLTQFVRPASGGFRTRVAGRKHEEAQRVHHSAGVRRQAFDNSLLQPRTQVFEAVRPRQQFRGKIRKTEDDRNWFQRMMDRFRSRTKRSIDDREVMDRFLRELHRSNTTELSRKKRGIMDTLLRGWGAKDFIGVLDRMMEDSNDSIYPYTRAALMGYTGDSNTCGTLYPRCPTNTEEMIDTFNNLHNYFPNGIPFKDKLPFPLNILLP